MPRSSIPVITALGPYPALPLTADSADVVLTALTGTAGANGNQAAFGNFNRLLLLLQNSGAAPYTVTINSLASANVFNRTGDVTTYSLGVGEFMALFIERNGWVQADGMLYFEATNVAVKAGIFGIS